LAVIEHDDERVERVAIAIYEASVHAAIIHGWRAEPEALRERFRKAARAAIEAHAIRDHLASPTRCQCGLTHDECRLTACDMGD
jgi:hypothetical protein